MLNVLQPPAEAATVGDIVAENIRPMLRAIDRLGVYPEVAMRRLGAAGAFSHHVGDDAADGGLERAIAAMAEVGETCLSTAFCMWCQDALAWYLARSGNDGLKRRMLPAIASGDRLGGTGLSNPMKALSGIERLALRGEKVRGGYRVTGRLPWVSNIGDDHAFAAIFAREDGRLVMALFDCAADGVSLAQNAHFIAHEGTRTFSVLLRNVFVPDADVIAQDATTFMPGIRQGFILLQLGMAIGAAHGAASIMERDASGRRAAAWLPLPPEAIRDRADAISARASALAMSADDPSRSAFLDVLRLRLEGSWLALQATETAALQFGARGYLKGSDVDRRRREALFVALVTPSIKHITKELAVEA